MKIFIAGCYSRTWIHDEIIDTVKKNDMQLYLAGQNGKNRIISDAIISRRSMALETGGGV